MFSGCSRLARLANCSVSAIVFGVCHWLRQSRRCVTPLTPLSLTDREPLHAIGHG
jgi:hypothetical protein